MQLRTLILNIVNQISTINSDIPQFQLRNIRLRDAFTPIAREQKHFNRFRSRNILAFSFIPTYQLQDRRINDLINIFLVSLLFKTDGFYVAANLDPWAFSLPVSKPRKRPWERGCVAALLFCDSVCIVTQ